MSLIIMAGSRSRGIPKLFGANFHNRDQQFTSPRAYCCLLLGSDVGFKTVATIRNGQTSVIGCVYSNEITAFIVTSWSIYLHPPRLITSNLSLTACSNRHHEMLSVCRYYARDPPDSVVHNCTYRFRPAHNSRWRLISSTK